MGFIDEAVKEHKLKETWHEINKELGIISSDSDVNDDMYNFVRCDQCEKWFYVGKLEEVKNNKSKFKCVFCSDKK